MYMQCVFACSQPNLKGTLPCSVCSHSVSTRSPSSVIVAIVWLPSLPSYQRLYRAQLGLLSGCDKSLDEVINAPGYFYWAIWVANGMVFLICGGFTDLHFLLQEKFFFLCCFNLWCHYAKNTKLCNYEISWIFHLLEVCFYMLKYPPAVQQRQFQESQPIAVWSEPFLSASTLSCLILQTRFQI